ncbi:MAG: hypothetical protein PWP49_662 [Thermococcaceae archaeon]|jgi:hypothetical protein|uniref:hypothetical protein n=1 Tax=Thermococcus TaxID=2263 RepID=UPI0005B2A872|nr:MULTISPECIES: hypothetical protein [Thermococcus]MBC7108940.1 hypothetical protein [Methanomassiliicoccales archaeon]MDK2854189.1 hypothetical protein [Thermococcaceae archaeon]MCA6213611.1 hypothetical protein [Thermococcus bergensis]MDN5320242.1 hypothetical protein [Thermococcaceae archaeon]MPW38770.1 hypothetical protein [Thermococcus sp. 101 C5]
MRPFRIVELTAVPLFVFSFILIITGYGIVSPKVISIFTFGLVSYQNAPTLHSYRLIRYGFSVLLLVHSYAGFEVFGLKKIRNRRLRLFLSYLLLFIVIYVVWVATITELGEIF